MTRTEHLLIILAEECNEVAQRIAKALRFSLAEREPGQLLTNAERIKYELNDLHALVELLQAEQALPSIYDPALVAAKKQCVEQFLLHSQANGCLSTAIALLPETQPAPPTPLQSPLNKPLRTAEEETKYQRKKELSAAVRRIFKHWTETHQKKAPKFSPDRQLLIYRALTKFGFEEAQIIQAINGCAMSPFHQGITDNGSTGQLYNDIELILRNPKQIERFMEIAARPIATPTQKGNYYDEQERRAAALYSTAGFDSSANDAQQYDHARTIDLAPNDYQAINPDDANASEYYLIDHAN